ncbi:pilus assembly protein [Streptomyces sp. 130]|uniref:TadE/TadG family type IV pilus assembly protein n=1 Tax=Streptomyces sp. 130 TaxID=2591006 RepID=UPI00117FFF52|nr:TadE/TadG family type IV pilus assembly protein [Streptomyces sp. 130]TRV81770.1 pilus assembly protein [Streptomyces sp. 130]
MKWDDRGSEAVQAAIVTPLMIIFLCLALAGGRVVTAGNKVDAAAEDAAREASISRTAGAARSNALAAARETLADQGLTCSGTRVSVDASGLNAPLGTVGTVRVTVACTVPLSDLMLPGAPGSHTLTSTFTSAVDAYRERD